MTPALILAATLMASSAPPPTDGGEPLPPGAPTDEYELSAWCYGALAEYLSVYDKVKPDLVAIDKLFGDPVKEDEPYQSDIAAARKELKMIGDAVTLAEKASPHPIAPEGAEALRMGRAIWSVAETKTNRELARAWLTWGLPDRCDSVSRQLAAKSLLLGKALSYNQGQTAPVEDDAGASALSPTSTPQPAPEPQPTPSAEPAPPPAAILKPPPRRHPKAQAAAAQPTAPRPDVAAPDSAALASPPPAQPLPTATDTPATAEATPPPAPTPAPPPPPPAASAGATPADEPQEPVL
jgi:hypothetical protein